MRPTSTLDPSEGIRLDRTYRTCDLVAFMSVELIGWLVRFYSLLPLGGKEHIYFGQNVIESLIRQVKDERVEQKRCRVTVAQLRKEHLEARRKAVRHGA